MNDINENEIQSNVQDLIEIYQFVKKEELDVEFDFETISIVHIKSDTPYLQLCLTPYALLERFVNHYTEEEDKILTVKQQFVKPFQYYANKIETILTNDQSDLEKFIGNISSSFFNNSIIVFNG